MLLSFPDSLSGLFFALLGVYLFFASSATKLHFFLGVFLHFITGDDTDGTTGPHWSMEQTEQARKQRGIDCDPLAFYVTMNMMHSDYCKAAEKVNASSVDFYAYMARAFVDDKDAGDGKISRYFSCVVKH